ncbi:MAG: addiction module toxin RelE [Bacteroidales bacterium]|nr:addiction module toxin RelE [Bacteroidales bacterium]
MSCRIEYLPEFERELRRLAKRYRSIKDDYAQLLQDLQANPSKGVDMGDGIRKVRMAISSKGKGKSAGARVITYNVITRAEEGRVVLVTIYDKSELGSITKREIVERLHSAGLKK